MWGLTTEDIEVKDMFKAFMRVVYCILGLGVFVMSLIAIDRYKWFAAIVIGVFILFLLGLGFLLSLATVMDEKADRG